jgi:patatin-like phospholipase/acyl hydrolase
MQSLTNPDGGGIRGYWQLVVLERLMEEIAKVERDREPKAMSSLHPLEAIGQGEHEKKEVTDAYLPCHYFDFIGGSSTGG